MSKKRWSVSKISWWQLVLGRIFCPNCHKKMDEIKTPWESCWQCMGCGWQVYEA